MDSPLDRYLALYSEPLPKALDWVRRETFLRTNHARMLSGDVQGHLLAMLVRLTGAKRILELGTFTGFSAICLASAMPEGGHLDTLEINDELEDVILEGFRKAGLEDVISLHLGDCKKSLEALAGPFDFVYMDANKREYCEYYELIIDKMTPGGLILADNVLWDGKVYEDPMPQDKQTAGIARFNEMIKNDRRVENFILPLRDGLNVIRVK